MYIPKRKQITAVGKTLKTTAETKSWLKVCPGDSKMRFCGCVKVGLCQGW